MVDKSQGKRISVQIVEATIKKFFPEVKDTNQANKLFLQGMSSLSEEDIKLTLFYAIACLTEDLILSFDKKKLYQAAYNFYSLKELVLSEKTDELSIAFLLTDKIESLSELENIAFIGQFNNQLLLKALQETIS